MSGHDHPTRDQVAHPPRDECCSPTPHLPARCTRRRSSAASCAMGLASVAARRRTGSVCRPAEIVSAGAASGLASFISTCACSRSTSSSRARTGWVHCGDEVGIGWSMKKRSPVANPDRAHDAADVEARLALRIPQRTKSITWFRRPNRGQVDVCHPCVAVPVPVRRRRLCQRPQPSCRQCSRCAALIARACVSCPRPSLPAPPRSGPVVLSSRRPSRVGRRDGHATTWQGDSRARSRRLDRSPLGRFSRRASSRSNLRRAQCVVVVMALASSQNGYVVEIAAWLTELPTSAAIRATDRRHHVRVVTLAEGPQRHVHAVEAG